MSSPSERFTAFQAILSEAETVEERKRLARLYSMMNGVALKLEKKVDELEDLLAVPIAQTRPPSSFEALATRETSINAIVASVGDDVGSNAAFELITDEHAIEIVAGKTSTVTHLGCFESDLVSGHRNGYVRFNLRKSPSRVSGNEHRLIGAQVYLHQLALVAAGRREELKATMLEEGGGGLFQISHLCHNGKCFNSEHLLVERSFENKARNTCQGHAIVKYKDEFVYHPCDHGQTSMRKKCILPVERYSEPGHFHPS